MRGILLYFLVIFIISGCATTESKNVEISDVKPTPLSSNATSNLAPTPFPTPLSTPSATPDGIQSPIKDLDYTIVKFDKSKMKTTTLDTQPLEILNKTVLYGIIKTQKDFPDIFKDEMTKAKKIVIKIIERDFNHDGIDERVILSRGETGEEVESFDVFRMVNGKWDSIFGLSGNPDYPKIMELEFLVNPNKTGFDLIKEIFKDPDSKEVLGQILYYQMLKEGNYEKVECQELPEDGGNVIPCRWSM
jgi:hypothetical protein